MKVSVVIPSLANEETKPYLKLCVESLRATTDWSIIVVTNGGSYKPDLSDIKGITTHLHTRDQGQCNAVNIGLQVTGPVDYILVSNDDMYYPKDWTKNLRFDYLVFSPNLIEPTDNAGSAPPFRKLNAGNNLESFDSGMVDYFSKIFLTNEYIEPLEKETGFNLPFFIRKDIMQMIGGYDIKYDPWGSNSDTDLQTKINLGGITPMRLRNVLVYHFSNKSGTFDGTHQDAWQKNWDYFDQKWGFNRDKLGSDVWYNKNMLPNNPEDIKYKPDWRNKWTS